MERFAKIQGGAYKTLLITDASVANPSSGSEMVCHHQAAGLSERGMEVVVLARTGVRKEAKVKRIGSFTEYCYFAPTDRPALFFNALLRRPSRLFDQASPGGGFDLMIVHQPLGLLSLRLKGKLGQIPIIYVFHSPGHEEFLLKYGRTTASPGVFFSAGLRRHLERVCVRRARKVMTLSRYMAQKLRAVHGIDETRVDINPGGVDLKRFQPCENRLNIKKKLRLPEGRVHLFTLRNLEPRMGMDRLVEAVSILVGKGLPVHLTVGGEGPERRRLEALSEKWKMTGHIDFTGFLKDAMLRDYYGSADFFVLPTRELEGFGLVTPESMACGTPVLGTPVGGTKEILSRFDPIFLFDGVAAGEMAAGIERTIEAYPVSSPKYTALRNRCRKYTESRFSWKRHVDQLATVIQEVVGRDRR
ncbi:MAG: glycosyltransferase family 4 protein [Desulfobacterales bacterium]|nr:glycosyltransferase family 4 protein [Desulfobacterales bacterium]